MVTIRPATLADVPAIVAIHCSDIITWKRWDAQGQAHLARYAELKPVERWMNGGPWLDQSSYAGYLGRLLRPDSGGVALVAEAAEAGAPGQVRAVAEASVGDEPAPFGRNLDISVIYTLRGYAGQGLGSRLMQALEAHARQAGCPVMMVTHAEAPRFYARHGFAPAQTWRRARLPAQPSNTQYQAEALTPGDYALVRGWGMPVGRYQSARQEWERIRPGAEPDFAEWRHLKRERWRLAVRQRPALLALEEDPRQPGLGDVHLWLPPGDTLSRQLLAAIRDRAARSGFAELMFFMAEASLPLLGRGWQDDGYKQQVWLKGMEG